MKFVCDKHKNLGIGLTIQFKGGVFETDDQEKIEKLTGEMADKYGIVTEGGGDNLGTPYVVFEVDENAEGQRPQVTAVIEGPDEPEAVVEFGPEDAVLTDEEREALEEIPAEDGEYDGEDDETFSGIDDVSSELLQLDKDQIDEFAKRFGIDLDKRKSVKNMVKDFTVARAKMTDSEV